MANRNWSDDEIREAIKDAHRIYMEDHGNRALYDKLHSQYGGEGEPKNDPSGAPPPKDPPAEPPAEKPKRSLWWGETEGSE